MLWSWVLSYRAKETIAVLTTPEPSWGRSPQSPAPHPVQGQCSWVPTSGFPELFQGQWRYFPLWYDRDLSDILLEYIYPFHPAKKKKINLTVLLICSTNNYGKKYTNKTWKGVEVSSQKFSDVFPFLLELEVLMRGRNFLVLTDKRTTSEENKSIQAKPLRFFIEDFSTLVLGVHCFYIDEKSA